MVDALAFAAYGGIENLTRIEAPAAAPGPEQVAIEVRASGLNPVDYKLGSGYRGSDPEKLPLRVGFEAAGVITAVGSAGLVGADGARLEVGQEVIVFRAPGAHAAELVVPAVDVLQKPASLSFEAAAGLLLAAATAWDALDIIDLTDADTLLVHGAAGSVGRAVVQLAVQRGARVIGTAAPGRFEELRALGAEPVTYGDGLAERVQALGTVTAAVDTVGTAEALEVTFALVAPERAVTIANAPGFQERGGHAIGAGNPRSEAIRDAARAELVRLAGAGELVIPVVAAYPAADFRAAFDLLLDGHAGGKIVLTW